MAGIGDVERVVQESPRLLDGFARALARGLSVVLVNPLTSEWFGWQRLKRAEGDPANPRTVMALAIGDCRAVGDPLVGAEVREAARARDDSSLSEVGRLHDGVGARRCAKSFMCSLDQHELLERYVQRAEARVLVVFDSARTSSDQPSGGPMLGGGAPRRDQRCLSFRTSTSSLAMPE